MGRLGGLSEGQGEQGCAPVSTSESIEEFEQDLQGNLYKLWNRLSSGSYFPPPVRAVEIPKAGRQARECSGCRLSRTGSPRQWSCARIWSRRWSRCSTRTPTGIGRGARRSTRWGRAGSGAGGTTGCSILTSSRSSTALTMGPHAARRSPTTPTSAGSCCMSERWLKAPLQREDGSLVERDRGTPQGSAISPLLANLYPALRVRRVDGPGVSRPSSSSATAMTCIVHARSERQALQVRAMIAQRLAECGLELTEHKTRIVYCQDDDRRGSHEHTSFDFLGYTFRPRLSKNRFGKHFVNFSPAVIRRGEDGDAARDAHAGACTFARTSPSRTWRACSTPSCRAGSTTTGASTSPCCIRSSATSTSTLVRWAMRKYKRLAPPQDTRARRFIADVARRQPGLFAHWRFGVRPDGWTMGAR